MKADTLRKRLSRDRPMISVTVRVPEDVIDDLKALAPALGFTGYQSLMKAYVGQGIRKDLKRLEGDKVSALIASLKRQGVSEKVIAEAKKEAEF